MKNFGYRVLNLFTSEVDPYNISEKRSDTMDDSMSDVDPYYSDDSVETYVDDILTEDNKTVLYDRVKSSFMDLECLSSTDQSKDCFDTVTECLSKTVADLERCDNEQARKHCTQAYSLLNDVTDHNSETLIGYDTCCTIFQQVTHLSHLNWYLTNSDTFTILKLFIYIVL